MSHELRTPLNGILGFAQLLVRRTPRDPEDQQGLQVILKSGEHLLGLINDVLSLAKIEAGRITLEAADFDLAALARDVMGVLRFRAEEKSLLLACEMDEAALPPAVHGDEGRLRQILLNLLGNAVKFTEHGSVLLRVAWQDGRARLTVEDTGPGISAVDQARLFEPFSQTDLGQRVHEGTGLGLALSRDLARLMGGDITLASTPGRGSTFTVEVALPVAEAATAAPRERRRVAALAPDQGEVRILVVDDLALNRTVLSRLLAAVGFTVREAASGADATALWESWQPHLVWMDKRMHDVDGLEATRRIRAAERASGRARVPILALSASALEHERSEILAAGCDDFVPKPYREATIFAKLAEHLGVRYVYERDAPLAAFGVEARQELPPRPGVPSVLVVDDDWVCREVAQELLRGEGVAVTTASGGSEALTLLARGAYDLLLVDLQMPGMDGVETARRAREMPHAASLPIVAMSADEDPNDRLASAGVDDYLPKPVDPAALRAIVRRWLRAPASTTAVEPPSPAAPSPG
jgi:CheY-like chemotaxis protein/anti-sigma regulatory factor (Ser/Thr protein kinase)